MTVILVCSNTGWREHAPRPSWSALIEAIESTVLGRPDIASTIKTEQNIATVESISVESAAEKGEALIDSSTAEQIPECVQ